MPQTASIATAFPRITLASWIEAPLHLLTTKAVGNGASVSCPHESHPSQDGGDGHDEQAGLFRIQLIENTGLSLSDPVVCTGTYTEVTAPRETRL